MTLPGFDLISATGGWAFPIFAVLGCYFCYRLGRRVQKAKTEQAKDQELFAAYQEVILVTCGTLRLISPEEYQNAYPRTVLLVIDIKQKDDVRLVRQTVDQFFPGCSLLGRSPGDSHCPIRSSDQCG